jgi:hypothetical protein
MTDLIVIDCQKLTRLDKEAAEALDIKIKEAGQKLATDTDALLGLLVLAKAGQIHEALGFSSWPAYVMEVVRIEPTDKAERRMMAVLMNREGMSQRAIAVALSVDQKTISNDLRAGEENSSADTVGLDGKTYQSKGGAGPQRPHLSPWESALRKLTKTVDLLSNIGEDDQIARDSLAFHRSALEQQIERLRVFADSMR